MSDEMTTAEVAERLGVDRSRVRQLAIEGRFPGAYNTSPGTPRGEWRIPTAGLASYTEWAAQQQPSVRETRPGRPPRVGDGD